MSSTPDAPKVADPNVTAQQQQDLNSKAAQSSQAGSMVNQSNPFGNLSYSQTGTSPDGTPLYTASTTLSDANKQLLDILQGTQKSAGQQGNALISGANYGAVSPSDAIGNATSGLVKDAMSKQVSYLSPYFTQQTDQLDTKLRNQGFAPGQPGYDNAMRALQNNQGNTVTGFESQIEPQMFQQAQSTYLMPAQLGGTLAGLGSPTMPAFTPQPGLNVQPANLIGATANAQQAQQQSYQDQLQQSQAMMSGLFGIPTAVLGGWAKGGGLSSLLGAGGLGTAAAGAGADATMASLLGTLGTAAIL